jgi:hypothetical protein
MLNIFMQSLLSDIFRLDWLAERGFIVLVTIGRQRATLNIQTADLLPNIQIIKGKLLFNF